MINTVQGFNPTYYHKQQQSAPAAKTPEQSPSLMEIKPWIPKMKEVIHKSRYAAPNMTDQDWVLLACSEALKSPAGWGRVGAVLVKNGKMMGKGASVGGLRIHAEMDALKNAGTLGHPELNKDVTAYVTLQPCNFRDSGVPFKSCCHYLAESGVKKVVFAGVDPRVGEKGLDYLRSHGIQVEQIQDPKIQALGEKIFNLLDTPIPSSWRKELC
ncbi:MAG: deaminase [Firmicutes bacterium]|nr:deaminase [Bacillota bacterium]